MSDNDVIGGAVGLVNVLEVGGTHVTAASVDADENLVHERTRTALDSAGSAADILATMSGAASTLAEFVPTRWAVAIPDPFDYPRGIGLFRDVGKFDALYGVDVGRALGEAISPRPQSITFIHDTEAFLLGEWLNGSARGAHRCAAVTLGTGVGSAFLDDATIVRAGPGLPPDGRIHRLLVDGAPLEDTVSRRAIRARYAARAHTNLDVHEIAELARRRDPVAAAVLEHAFCALGRALGPLTSEFAPDVLVIGGSIARSWDLLIGPLTAGLAEAGVHSPDIRPALHEAESAVIGAARYATTQSRATTPGSAATRDAALRELARPDLVELLAAYYAPDGEACGTNFLDGTEALSTDEITAADLFAVTSLGRAVPPATARTLLRDTAAHAAIADCLRRLPADAGLDEAGADSLTAMGDLYAAVLAATHDAELAAALCARKRPELFAPLDPQAKRVLLLPQTDQDCWPVLGALLSQLDVRDELRRVFGAVCRRGTAADVHPLRQLAVVAQLSDQHS